MGRGNRESPARVIAEAIPSLVDELLSVGPGQLDRATVAVVERPLLARALASTRRNQLRAALLLGLNRNTLRKRCRQLNLLPARAPGVASAPDT